MFISDEQREYRVSDGTQSCAQTSCTRNDEFLSLIIRRSFIIIKDMERRSLEILIYVDRKKVKRIHVCLVENEKKEFSRSLIRVTLKILTLMG